VAREIKVPTSDDIWHLSIEDLLASPTEPARTAGQGPFVINLRTSTATIGSPPIGLLPFERLHVYQRMRSHEGQPQFQLRLGIIESELEADTLLSMVREHYPGAIKERAEDDDKAAIARAACLAEPAKPASTVGNAKAPVVQVPEKVAPPAARQAAPKPAEHGRLDIDELLAADDDKAAIARAARPAEPAKPARVVADAKAPVVQVSKKVAPPAARQATRPAARPAAPKPAEQAPWDIDELLPELAAVRPPGGEPKPPTCTASKGERKPPNLSTPSRSAKAQTDRVLTEPREHVNPARPVAKPAQLPVDIPCDASQAERAPTSALVPEIESDPNAITDQVEVLTLTIERLAGAPPEPDSRRLDPAAPIEPKTDH
jgi:hypothetical protein